MSSFTHLDANGNPSMVDVGEKAVTKRTATARSIVVVDDEIIAKFVGEDIHTKKGPVFQTAIIAGGRKRYTKQYVEQNPIPIITEAEQKPFIELVNQILNYKDKNIDTTELENKIDHLVYQLYDLTEEEIKIVEG